MTSDQATDLDTAGQTQHNLKNKDVQQVILLSGDMSKNQSNLSIESKKHLFKPKAIYQSGQSDQTVKLVVKNN